MDNNMSHMSAAKINLGNSPIHLDEESRNHFPMLLAVGTTPLAEHELLLWPSEAPAGDHGEQMCFSVLARLHLHVIWWLSWWGWGGGGWWWWWWCCWCWWWWWYCWSCALCLLLCIESGLHEPKKQSRRNFEDPLPLSLSLSFSGFKWPQTPKTPSHKKQHIGWEACQPRVPPCGSSSRRMWHTRDCLSRWLCSSHPKNGVSWHGHLDLILYSGWLSNKHLFCKFRVHGELKFHHSQLGTSWKILKDFNLSNTLEDLAPCSKHNEMSECFGLDSFLSNEAWRWWAWNTLPMHPVILLLFIPSLVKRHARQHRALPLKFELDLGRLKCFFWKLCFVLWNGMENQMKIIENQDFYRRCHDSGPSISLFRTVTNRLQN